MCQIFTAEHETSLSLRVCCGLGLLFVCCTLLLLAQASPLTPKLWREVMWAKTATTTKLCTLKATTDGFCTSWNFFTRVHTLFFFKLENERSRRFFGCEFNHLQYVARFMPYVLLLLERKMVHFSRHIPLLLFGDWISHNTLSS